MDTLRALELAWHPDTIVDESSCPDGPTNFERNLMSCIVQNIYEGKFMFLDMVRDDEGWCFPVYIWKAQRESETSSFLLRPGHRLSEKDEAEFCDCCRDKRTMIYSENLKSITSMVNSVMPDVHLVFYKNPAHTILHLYFTLFPGVREILWKANLNYLAAEVENMSEINMIASSPTDLFDGLTMRALRLLNSEYGAHELALPEGRKQALETYRLFSQHLNGLRYINESLWEYLKDCARGVVTYQKQAMRMMYEDGSGNRYADYCIYRAKASLIDKEKYCPKMLPDLRKLDTYMNRADYLLMLMEHEDELKNKMEKTADRLSFLDFDECGPYFVTHPKTIEDILDESVGQSNCLISMVTDIATGRKQVGFMRDVRAPWVPLVTFEIENNKITQFWGKYNLCPTEAQRNWFCDTYLPTKGFTMPGEEAGDLFRNRLEELEAIFPF